MTVRDRLRLGDDTGSLAMTLLLTLVGVTLSALLVPMVLTRISSTRATMQRTDALNAAQAGIDAALGQMRAARDGNGTGVIHGLPCEVPVTAVGPGSSAAYEVTVIYLATDPRDESDAWLDSPANQIRCIPGSGTAGAPAFAVLRSTGTAGATKRTLRSTYRFTVTNQPLSGGLIHINGTGMCLDAGSTAPANGTNLVVQPCSPDNPQQLFAYGKNLNIYLAATRVPGNLGRCLDAGTPQHSGAPIQFHACASPTEPQQQWSFNDDANFQGNRSETKSTNFCFSVTGTAAGSPVELRSCPSGATSFSPEALVGAGAAGASSQQLVNLSQFGRCLDVTDFDVNKGFLIVWPCKQAPNPADIGWNQKWSLPTIAAGAKSAAGPITTTDDRGRRYCLRSPRTTAAFQYVTVAPCQTAAQQWIVYGDTGNDTTSFHIVDDRGYCLSPTDPTATPPDFFSRGYQISKVVVATCNRSSLQRWNSPALRAGLEDLREQ